MKDFFKNLFVEAFTLMAWITLLSYVAYCTAMGIKTDSVRDAWNILILIAGFVWGNAAKQNKKTDGTTIMTTDAPTTITTESTPKEETQQ